jgi:predicted DCC family thiol-disulfide oxidoreductase YuxK
MHTTAPIVLFDGVCNLCNTSVQFIIEHDPAQQFRFASLQSEVGQYYALKAGLSTEDLSTILLLEGDRFYTRSTAALRIARRLNGGWALFYGFLIVPKFIRDAVYKFIARNRYRWFGKQESCWLPTPELKKLFLS